MFTGCESGQSYGSWWFHLLRFAEKDKFQGRPVQSQDTVVIQERNDFNICFFFPLLSMLSGSWCVGFWSHAYSFQKWITPISSSDMRSLPNAVKIRENICFLSFLVHFCDVFLHMTNRPDWIFFFLQSTGVSLALCCGTAAHAEMYLEWISSHSSKTKHWCDCESMKTIIIIPKLCETRANVSCQKAFLKSSSKSSEKTELAVWTHLTKCHKKT